MSLSIPDFSDLFDILHTELSPPVVRRDLGVRPKTDILETDVSPSYSASLPGKRADSQTLVFAFNLNPIRTK